MDKKETKDIRLKMVDVVIFVIIITLVITTLVNVDKFVFKKPEYGSYYKSYINYDPRDDNCDYSLEPQRTIMEDCEKDQGDVIYKSDCEVECDYTRKEQRAIQIIYEKKVSWFRMVLALLTSIVVLYIPFKQKDKLTYYAIIVGSLLTLIFTTLLAYDHIDSKLFPIITILELLIVLWIYKKISKKE